MKKLCRDIFSIQQTLCNITNQPEHALDHARTYFELFLHPPEVRFLFCTVIIIIIIALLFLKISSFDNHHLIINGVFIFNVF